MDWSMPKSVQRQGASADSGKGCCSRGVRVELLVLLYHISLLYEAVTYQTLRLDTHLLRAGDSLQYAVST